MSEPLLLKREAAAPGQLAVTAQAQYFETQINVAKTWYHCLTRVLQEGSPSVVMHSSVRSLRYAQEPEAQRWKLSPIAEPCTVSHHVHNSFMVPWF